MFGIVGTALFGRHGEAMQTGRGRRAGQRYGMDFLGTCEILQLIHSDLPCGTGQYK
jgi:hypothetical protein